MAIPSEHKERSGTTGTQGNILRKAGQLERYFNVRSRLNYQSWVISVAHYEHDGGVGLSKALVFTALEKMIRSQIALAAQLPPAPAPPFWIRMSRVDLNKTVTFLEKNGSTDLTAALEEIFETPIEFTDDLPLWRVWVFQDGYLAFGYDHTLGDGQSGPAFQANLLPTLRSISVLPAEHSGLVLDLPSDAKMTPAVETVIDVSIRTGYAVKELSKVFFPSLYPRLSTAWTAHPVTSDGIVFQNRTRVIFLAPGDGKCLVDTSREHRTTLTGTLHTLALVIFAQLIPKHDNECTHASGKKSTKKAATPKTILTVIPISLRRFTRVRTPQTAVCNYASVHRTAHDLPPALPTDAAVTAENFPWATAATLSETLKRKAPRAARVISLIKLFHGNYETDITGAIGKKRTAAFEISNLGAFPALAEVAPELEPSGVAVDGYDPAVWRIHEVLFAQADATLGAAIKLNVVGTLDGGLGVSLTWGKDAIEDEFAEEFVTRFFAGLHTLVGSSSG